MSIAAILLAAGRGRRMGADENKILLTLAGQPVLWHAIRAFAAARRVDELVLVARPGEEDRVLAMAPGGTTVTVVRGGEYRRDSALAGVLATGADVVLIHDGARPFPSTALIERVIEGTLVHGACVPVVPVIDTLRTVDEHGRLVDGSIARDRLARMQTPQGFRSDVIRPALREAAPTITDDAAAVLLRGGTVWTVPGESTNLKITTQDDLLLAEALRAKAL